MSEEMPIGPNSCPACSGEYGEHDATCRLADPDYALWRKKAELRLANLEQRALQRQSELSRLHEEIDRLSHVMGNGSSGGTAWKLPENAIPD